MVRKLRKVSTKVFLIKKTFDFIFKVAVRIGCIEMCPATCPQLSSLGAVLVRFIGSLPRARHLHEVGYERLLHFCAASA